MKSTVAIAHGFVFPHEFPDYLEILEIKHARGDLSDDEYENLKCEAWELYDEITEGDDEDE